ncbi:MAG TPA: hypothetical protein VFS37_13645 [Conexibacter sp.]|nr:hypothetical protein [Conexibacter sp.]
MSTHGAARTTGMGAADDVGRRRTRISAGRTETKSAFKTTEMIAYVLVTAGVLIAGAIADGFGARSIWLYVTILTVGYMVSRGLAKSGSQEPYVDGDH